MQVENDFNLLGTGLDIVDQMVVAFFTEFKSKKSPLRGLTMRVSYALPAALLAASTMRLYFASRFKQVASTISSQP